MRQSKMTQFIDAHCHYGWLLMLTLLFIVGIDVDAVLAAAPVCTTDPAMQANTAGSGGIVTAIMSTIVNLLSVTSENLYNGVVADSDFVAARNGAILLVIVIYGISILFDIANFRPGEILSILFKIALIMTVTSPGGWSFISENLGRFFYGTMNEMIGIFTGVTATNLSGSFGGTASAANIAQPLQVLNWPMGKLVSVHFFITLLGVFFTWPLGPPLAFLMIWAGFQLLMALFGALFTYVKSIVGLWFLFALSPIFFICLLFQRTRNLFEGWINMVVSFTLQPILLFAFFAFFIVIVTSSLESMMTVKWCWAQAPSASTGLPFEFWMWRADEVDGVSVKNGYFGLFGYMNNARAAGQPIFPVDIIDILFFLLSSYIAREYSVFVPQIANELSSSGLRISASAESMRNYFKSRGMTPSQVATSSISKAAKFIR